MRNAALSLAASESKDAAERSPNQSLIDELNDAVATGGIEQRIKILERITDLFVAGSRGYTGEQIGLFDDVLQELSAEIETKARAKLAHRLAHISNSPPALIRKLAFDDEIAVAEPVLVHSQQLSDADLVENATTKSQDHLFAIAQRLKLSEQVTDILVERGNRRVLRRVVRNKGARFSEGGYGKLTVKARGDTRLTLALGRRADIPRQCFLKLLESASAAVRDKLERAEPSAVPAIRDTIDEVAIAMQREVRATSRGHTAAVRNAKFQSTVRAFTEANIHGPARAQEFERTVVALARLGRFPVDLVERALLDKGEDMILILAKAAGCSWTTARELLLMYVAERELQPKDLALAFERYKKLTQETARKVINFHERRLELRGQRAGADEE